MRHFTILTALCIPFLALVNELHSQSIEIQSPLDIPLYLSGNYGEIRSTHFHAGIDLKTNSKVGQPVRTLAEGYVSRIKIRAGGYGKAIYITHLNGNTSVYGHLDDFYPEVNAFIKNEQYRKRSFEVDVYLEKNKFIVTKGMQIGVSGNTGSSGGPHVHLEYRDANQVPLNLLVYDLPIKDNIKPQLRKLFVYDNINPETYQWESKKSIAIEGDSGNYRISRVIRGTENIGFGIEGYDYLNGSSNRCGIYTIEFKVDGKLIFSSEINNISFNETKYIKSYADYEEKRMRKKGVHRLFVEPNNKLSVYKNVVNNGLISCVDSVVHSGEIIAKDAHGNASRLVFGFSLQKQSHKEIEPNDKVRFYGGKANVYEDENMRFVIASGSLYADKWLSFSSTENESNALSKIYILGDENIPTHTYPKLSLKPIEQEKSVVPDKIVVVRIDSDGGIHCEGGVWSKGWVTAKVKGFGKYTLMVDSTMPTIKSISFREGWYQENDIISFRIKDDLSGIKTYNGYIDDKWVLFEYDAKTNKIFHKLDADKLEHKEEAHSLKIYVMDERNNVQSFKSSFYY